jgi:hypothetical protein
VQTSLQKRAFGGFVNREKYLSESKYPDRLWNEGFTREDFELAFGKNGAFFYDSVKEKYHGARNPGHPPKYKRKFDSVSLIHNGIEGAGKELADIIHRYNNEQI